MLVPPESKPRGGSLPCAKRPHSAHPRPGLSGSRGIVVAELKFPFRSEQPREHSDDPRVRCRWRWAMWISMGFSEMGISFLLRLQFQRRRRGATGVLTELDTEEGYFIVG